MLTEARSSRLASGRFVRNLALSLSGGALLTVAGAAVAAADDAATSSDGAGGIGSGDATAVGNTSGTSTQQGVAPSGGGANPTVVTQTAVVPNVGVALANTGGNSAAGNSSTNTNAGTQTATGGAIATSNSGEVANASDGTATISTGNATASGNRSQTTIDQTAHGALGILTSQNAFVLNAGVGVANAGLNTATGNTSTNTTGFLQEATNTTGLATNSAASTNASNGTATIVTGAAVATGNKSETWLDQTAGGTGDDDPGGLLVIDQLGIVANLGAGLANTGGNTAIGNTSDNTIVDDSEQEAVVADTTEADLSLATNQAELTNSSDGEAAIDTGDASATGNDSNTNLTQAAHGEVSSMGGMVSTQIAAVLNAGVGVANTGLNLAVGNASTSSIEVDQAANVGPGPSDIDAPIVTASNAASATNGSDGSAEVRTGNATATGNSSASSTHVTQEATGQVDGSGLVVNTQIAAVANVGLAIANTGGNLAIGNVSDNVVTPDNFGPTSGQDARIDGDVNATGPLTASNALDLSNTSDGSARVRTGDATAVGNESDTWITQESSGTVGEGSMGVIPNVQVAGVLNAGAAVANSGLNVAIGNASGQLTTPNTVGYGQFSSIDPTAPVALNVVGPVTAFNSGEFANASDGAADVDTGNASATGNASYTAVSQELDANIDGMGVPVAPQLALVANLGVGVANSGVNAAVGNISTSSSETSQEALAEPNVNDVTIIGPLTVGATASSGNTSDGDACACTGDATASGNVSRSTIMQDVDVTATDGVVVAPTTGLILNVGFGLANSGVNLAIGNVSNNTTTLDQDAELDPAAPPLLVGPQTIVNGGGASNSSDGAAKVGSGRATATGNLSESELVQAATISGSGVIAPINSTIANAGLALANSGVNLGVGNDSTNVSNLTQTASGAGTVSNQGEASNSSDGTAQINDCDEDTPPPTDQPDEPGVPSLPRTGGAIETMAAVALMLLLAGFAAQGLSRRRLTAVA